MNKYIAKKYKSEKYRNEHYNLGKMKNDIFFTRTLSFHLHTDWRRRRITFTDDGKATPFRPSLRFSPFRHYGQSIQTSNICRRQPLCLIDIRSFHMQHLAGNFYSSDHASAAFVKSHQPNYYHSFRLVNLPHVMT